MLGFPVSQTTTLSVGGGFDMGLSDIYEDLDYKTRTFYLFLAYNMLLGG